MNSFGIIPSVILSIIIDNVSAHEELMNDIKKGNVGKASRLIRSGLSPNQLNEYGENGETPLGLALYEKYGRLALLLIERGADVNAATKMRNRRVRYGSAPLHIAVWNHLTPCVSALIAAGASANAKDCKGFTPLMLLVQDSCGRYNADMARMLLNAGADVNEPEYSYREEAHPIRPLHHAARNWNAPVAELLLSKGADANEMAGVRRLKAPADYVMIYNYSLAGYSGKAKDTAVVLLNNGADGTDANDFRIILDTFWTPAHFALDPGTCEHFDDFLLKITARVGRVSEAMSKKGNDGETFSLMGRLRKLFRKIRRISFNGNVSATSKIRDAAREFDRQGMFALYRLLKCCYGVFCRKTRSSPLECLKFDVFDHVANEISKGTFFEKIPLEVTVDVLHEAGYYWWKIERFAWNVALAAYSYRPDTNATSRIFPNHSLGEIAYNLLLESEKDLWLSIIE